MNWKKYYDFALIMTFLSVLACIIALGTFTHFTFKIQSVRNEYKELEPKLAELKTEKVKLDNDKKELEIANTKLTQAQTQLKKEKKEIEDQIRNLDPELAKAKAELKTAIETIATLKKETQQQIEELTSKLNDKTIEAENLQTEIDRVKALVNSTGDLIADIKELKNQNESYVIRISRLESDITIAKNDFKKAQEKLNDCKDAYRSYITSARGGGEIKPWWVQLPSYYGISGPDAF